MRSVAVILVALTTLASFPTTVAADECQTPGALSFCFVVNAERPNTPPGVPAVPHTPYWGKYYLWVGPGHCLGGQATLNDCMSWPPAPGSGVPKPDGSGPVVSPRVFGVLFMESNGVPGLQRSQETAGGNRAPDRTILV